MLPFRVYRSLSCWYYGHPREGWPWGTILALSPMSRSEYSQCNLPSYQFENSRHWIERMDQALHILQNGLRCKAPCCKSSTRWYRESKFSSPSRSLENHRAKPVRADCAGELSYLWCFFVMARTTTWSPAGRRRECMWLWEPKPSRWGCYRWENWPSVSIFSTGRGRGRGAGSCERRKWISIQFYKIAGAGYARLLLHRVT